jgi:hypothetical protein
MQLYLGTSVYGYSDGWAVTPRLWPKFIQCRRHSRTESHSILNPTETGLCRFIQYIRTTTLATQGLFPPRNKSYKV